MSKKFEPNRRNPASSRGTRGTGTRVKIIIALLLLLTNSFCALFALPQKASAQSLPNPADPICNVEIITAGTSKYNALKCTVNNVDLIFIRNLTYLGAQLADLIPPRPIDIWRLQNSPEDFGNRQYDIITAHKSGGTINDFSDLIGVRIGYVLNSSEYSICEGNDYCDKVKYPDAKGNYTNQIYFKTIGYGHTDWNEIKPQTIKPGAENISEAMRLIGIKICTAEGLTIGYKASADPSAQAQTACNAKGITTILNNNDAALNDLLGKISSGLNTSLDEYAQLHLDTLQPAKLSDIKNKIAEVINKQKSQKNIIDNNNDQYLFTRFYRTQVDGKPWPNILITQDVLQQFRDYITQESGEAADAALSIKGIFGLRNKFMEMLMRSEVEDGMRTEMKIAYSYYYLSNNMEYRKCAKDYDAEYAQFDQDIYDQIQALLTGTYNTLNPAMEEQQDTCDKISDEGIRNMIGKALCAMAVLIKRSVIDKIFCLALSWLESSVGLETTGEVGNPTENTTQDVCQSDLANAPKTTPLTTQFNYQPKISYEFDLKTEKGVDLAIKEKIKLSATITPTGSSTAENADGVTIVALAADFNPNRPVYQFNVNKSTVTDADSYKLEIKNDNKVIARISNIAKSEINDNKVHNWKITDGSYPNAVTP